MEDTSRVGRVPVEGSRVGDYILERHLASGAMGAVFIARLEGIEARHALKILALGKGKAEAATRWARFEREALSLSRLDHPGVVRVHAFGLVDGGEFGYLAMDWVKGKTLEELQEANLLSQDQSLRIVVDIARALAHVHDAGIMHRDVKPANVIVRADTGRPVLCDFGLVRDEHDASLTKSQQLLGTPRFMAPELVTGDRHAQGPATDVFALGVILYFVLSGEYPFAGADLPSLAGQILTLTPKPPSAWREAEHRGLDRIVMAALAKEPAERPSASDVADAIELSLRGELARSPAWTRWLSALAVLAVALTASIALVASPRSETRADASAARASEPKQPSPTGESSLVVAQELIALGDGKAALAAVTSARNSASPPARSTLLAVEAQALVLGGDLESAAKHLPSSESRVLELEKERREIEARVRARLQDPVTWGDANTLGRSLYTSAISVGTTTPLGKAIRSRVGETLALISLDAPTGEYSPHEDIATGLQDLSSLLGDDPRVAITRALVHEAQIANSERGRRLVELPTPEGLSPRWRYLLTILLRFKAVAGSEREATLDAVVGSMPGPDPIRESEVGMLERNFHFRYRETIANHARNSFFKRFRGDAHPTPKSLELAVTYAERALAVSGGFVPERPMVLLMTLAEFALCAGEYERAEALLQRIKKPNRETQLRISLLRIESLLERGQVAAADKLLRPKIDMSQTCADVWTLDARISAALGHPGKAKRLLVLVPSSATLQVHWRSPEITRRILNGYDPRTQLRRRP